jgi:hypothetical protein
MVSVSDDGKKTSFDPATGFIPFDGGSKKFVIKYDTTSKQYWTLANVIPARFRTQYPTRNPASFRNILMLRKSTDLIHWQDVKIILEHEDVINHGFQYVDWSFDGNDILVLSRTAFFDGKNNSNTEIYHMLRSQSNSLGG